MKSRIDMIMEALWSCWNSASSMHEDAHLVTIGYFAKNCPIQNAELDQIGEEFSSDDLAERMAPDGNDTNRINSHTDFVRSAAEFLAASILPGTLTSVEIGINSSQSKTGNEFTFGVTFAEPI